MSHLSTIGKQFFIKNEFTENLRIRLGVDEDYIHHPKRYCIDHQVLDEVKKSLVEVASYEKIDEYYLLLDYPINEFNQIGKELIFHVSPNICSEFLEELLINPRLKDVAQRNLETKLIRILSNLADTSTIEKAIDCFLSLGSIQNEGLLFFISSTPRIKALSKLTILLKNPSISYEKQIEIISILKAWGYNEALETIKYFYASLENTNPYFSSLEESCLSCLAELKDDSILDTLKEKLKQPYCYSAIDAIGRFRSPEVIPLLYPFLEHENPDIVGVALTSLNRVKTESSVPFIVEKLIDINQIIVRNYGDFYEHVYIYDMAGDILINFGYESAIPLIIDKLSQPVDKYYKAEIQENLLYILSEIPIKTDMYLMDYISVLNRQELENIFLECDFVESFLRNIVNYDVNFLENYNKDNDTVYIKHIQNVIEQYKSNR